MGLNMIICQFREQWKWFEWHFYKEKNNYRKIECYQKLLLIIFFNKQKVFKFSSSFAIWYISNYEPFIVLTLFWCFLTKNCELRWKKKSVFLCKILKNRAETQWAEMSWNFHFIQLHCWRSESDVKRIRFCLSQIITNVETMKVKPCFYNLFQWMEETNGAIQIIRDTFLTPPAPPPCDILLF